MGRKCRIISHLLYRHQIPLLLEPEKRGNLIAVFKLFKMRVFIETGTYRGATAKAFAPLAKTVISVELNPEFQKTNQRSLAPLSNIQLLTGDSATLLPVVLADLNEPAMFWLDAHYSGGSTAHGATASPILTELRCIFDHHVKQHIIAIDDSRDFLGCDGYPTLRALDKLVASTGAYMLRMRNDILLIVPNETVL